MAITITVFERALDAGRGLARDMRVRWALEEVGQPYEVRLAAWEKFKEEAHLARNPFGQIPTYEEGDLTLFESGAIVLHIAERLRDFSLSLRGQDNIVVDCSPHRFLDERLHIPIAALGCDVLHVGEELRWKAEIDLLSDHRYQLVSIGSIKWLR